MFDRCRPVAVLLGVVAAALLMVPASASAAAVVDHQVIDVNACDPPNAFFVNCANDHFVFTQIRTPSGIGIGSSLFDIEQTATGVPGGPFEGCVFTADAHQTGHFTDSGDINVVQLGHGREVDSQICNAPSDVVCITTFHVLSAKGRVVMNNFTTDCEPVTAT